MTIPPKPDIVPPFTPRPSGVSDHCEVITAAVFAVVSGVVIALLPEPRPPNNIWHYTIIGILFGGIFGNTTAASIWSSLGEGRHLVRSVLAILWMIALIVGLALMVFRGNGPNRGVVVDVSTCIVVQSCLIQIPMWLLRVWCGIRLVKPTGESTTAPERMQFGIVHMMIVTAIVAVLLGVGQGMVRLIGVTRLGGNGEWGIFLYLAIAAVLVTLPIVVATLIERRQLLAILAAVVFVGLATASEYPLMVAMGLQRSGPDFFHILGINVVSSLVVLLHGLALRWGGLRLIWGGGKTT